LSETDTLAVREPVANAFLRDDGTTACGNWIYSGSWTEAGPQLARRGPEDPSGLGIFPNWAWS